MRALKSLLRDPVSADDDLFSFLEALSCPDGVRSVSEAARESAGPVAQLTAPNHAIYDENDGAHPFRVLPASASSGVSILAQKAAARADNHKSMETTLSPPHDLYSRKNKLEKTRERNRLNQRACRERLRVRCCLLAKQLFNRLSKQRARRSAETKRQQI
jgi:hypothetical protein